MSHTASFCYLCHFLQVMLDAEDSWLSQRLQIFVQQGEAGPIALGAVLVGCVASVFGSSSSFRWPRHLPTQSGNAGRNSIGHPRRGAIVSSAGVARAARAARAARERACRVYDKRIGKRLGVRQEIKARDIEKSMKEEGLCPGDPRKGQYHGMVTMALQSFVTALLHCFVGSHIIFIISITDAIIIANVIFAIIIALISLLPSVVIRNNDLTDSISTGFIS